MGDRHDAEHPVAQARERLSEVGMGSERREAAHSAAEARQRLGEIAEELARRANPRYMRGAALNRTKERITGAPWILGVMGGAAGAMAGKFFGDRARERKRLRAMEEEPQQYPPQQYPYSGYPQSEGGRWDRPYDEYTATHEPRESPLITNDSEFRGEMHQAVGLGAAGAAAAAARPEDSGRWREPPQRGGPDGEHEPDRRGLGDRARHMASHVRERVPSRDELRQHKESLRHTTEEHPALWLLGAFAAGSFFGSMMPVTERERRMLGEAKVRAQSGIEGLRHQAWGQFEDLKRTAKSAAMEAIGEIARGRGRGSATMRQEEPAMRSAPQQQQQSGAWQPDGSDASSSRIRKHGPGSGPGASYHAGGTSEDERSQSGWSPPPDPNDVTRH